MYLILPGVIFISNLFTIVKVSLSVFSFISPRILKESWRAIMIVSGVRCRSLSLFVVVVTLLCPPMISLNG